MATTNGHIFRKVVVNGGNVVNGDYIVNNVNAEESARLALDVLHNYETLVERISDLEQKIRVQQGSWRTSEDEDSSPKLSQLPPGRPPTEDALEQLRSACDEQYLLRTYLASMSPDAVSLAPSMQVSSLGSPPTSDSASFVSAEQHLSEHQVTSGHVRQSKRFPIFVRGVPSMRSVLLGVELSSRVLEIESVIRARKDLPRFGFQLSYRGRSLNVSETMRSADIKPHSTLYCRYWPTNLSRPSLVLPDDYFPSIYISGRRELMDEYMIHDQHLKRLRTKLPNAHVEFDLASERAVLKFDKMGRTCVTARVPFLHKRKLLMGLGGFSDLLALEGALVRYWMIEGVVHDELHGDLAGIDLEDRVQNGAEDVLDDGVVDKEVELYKLKGD